MASFKALCLAGVASLAIAAPAFAADLPLPPPPPIYEPPAPAGLGGGWYLRGDAGIGAAQLRGTRSTFENGAIYGTADNTPVGFGYNDASISEQAIIGLGGGYQFNDYFRADVTGEYRTSARLRAREQYTGFCTSASGTCYDGYNSNIHNAVFLLNGYVDLGTWYRMTPYIGAGVGTSLNTFAGLTDTSLSTTGSGSASDKTKASLAYALMAGVSYALTPNLKLDVGYRYLDMGRVTSNAINCGGGAGCGYEVQSYRLSSHDVRVGLRYQFADFVPYAPRIPIIARY